MSYSVLSEIDANMLSHSKGSKFSAKDIKLS